MDNVVTFPPSASSMPNDPADPVGIRAYAIELEHEVANLQNVVAQQAVWLAAKRALLDQRNHADALRLSAVCLMAFVGGWLMDPPLSTPALTTAARAAHDLFDNQHQVEKSVRPAVSLTGVWI